MASVVHQTELATRIDESLAYLESEWADVPDTAAEWDSWDEYNRLDFVLEWPIREDLLHHLQGWCADGSLSVAQLQRFKALTVLINQNRPALEQLLKD